jgi:hypothetical protein
MYHTAVVQLLRPFLDFEGFPTSLVDRILWQHAQQGLFLLEEHYHSLDISRYQPVMQMFAILHLTDVVMRFYSQVPSAYGRDGKSTLKLAMSVLAKSHSGYPVAGTFLELIYKTAKDLMDPLPDELMEDFHTALPNKSRFLLDDIIDACTAPTYMQPVRSIQKRFTHTISAEWAERSPSFGFHPSSLDTVRLRQPSAEERGAQNLMQIRNLLNMN